MSEPVAPTGLPDRYVTVPSNCSRERLQKLCEERDNHEGDLARLTAFIISDRFQKVTERERELMLRQQTLLTQLVDILSERAVITEKPW